MSKIQQYSLIAVFVFAAAVIIFNMFGGRAPSDVKKLEKLVVAQDWQVRTIGETGLRVLTPSSMKQLSIKLDDNAKATIEKYEAFEYAAGTFLFRINHMVAKNDIPEQAYVDDLIKMIKSIPDYADLKFSTEKSSSEGITSVSISGEPENAEGLVFQSRIFSKGTNLWEITISYNSGVEAFKTIGRDVFSSAEIL